MSMHIGIIVCWIGKLPEWFDLWCLSVRYNTDIDWIFITDQNNITDAPSNMYVVNMTMQDIIERAKKTLKYEASGLKEPYKLCDLRPVYGILFSDELDKFGPFTHWGHCDIDMFFGDIRHFVNDDMLIKYDKIYRNGHLGIYKNSDEVNNRCYLKQSVFPFEKVLKSPHFYAFDEFTGIEKIYKKNSFPYISNRDFADISVRYNDSFQLNIPNKNAKYQSFYWEKGKIMRAYEDLNGNIVLDEWAYLHFQKKKLRSYILSHDPNAFWITPMGIYEKTNDIIKHGTLELYNRVINDDSKYQREYVKKKLKEFAKKSMIDKYIHIRQKMSLIF